MTSHHSADPLMVTVPPAYEGPPLHEYLLCVVELATRAVRPLLSALTVIDAVSVMANAQNMPPCLNPLSAGMVMVLLVNVLWAGAYSFRAARKVVAWMRAALPPETLNTWASEVASPYADAQEELALFAAPTAVTTGAPSEKGNCVVVVPSDTIPCKSPASAAPTETLVAAVTLPEVW